MINTIRNSHDKGLSPLFQRDFFEGKTSLQNGRINYCLSFLVRLHPRLSLSVFALVAKSQKKLDMGYAEC
jgi:hypothetical protein